jgi:hypothetical protein
MRLTNILRLKILPSRLRLDDLPGTLRLDDLDHVLKIQNLVHEHPGIALIQAFPLHVKSVKSLSVYEHCMLEERFTSEVVTFSNFAKKCEYFRNIYSFNQCSGSGSESGFGSTCFWASRIRILLSASKNSKKNPRFLLFCDFCWSFYL